MAVGPGGVPEGTITKLALQLQQKGQAQGIPGLGNVGSQSLEHYKQIVRKMLAATGRANAALHSTNPNDYHAQMLQYLGMRGAWARARNPAGGNLPKQGSGAGQSATNTQRRSSLPHFPQFNAGFFTPF